MVRPIQEIHIRKHAVMGRSREKYIYTVGHMIHTGNAYSYRAHALRVRVEPLENVERLRGVVEVAHLQPWYHIISHTSLTSHHSTSLDITPAHPFYPKDTVRDTETVLMHGTLERGAAIEHNTQTTRSDHITYHIRSHHVASDHITSPNTPRSHHITSRHESCASDTRAKTPRRREPTPPPPHTRMHI